MKRYLTILMVVWLTLTMSVCSLAAPFDRYSIDDEKETLTIYGTIEGAKKGDPITIEILNLGKSIDTNAEYTGDKIVSDFVLFTQVPANAEGGYVQTVGMKDRDIGEYKLRINGEDAATLFYASLEVKEEALYAVEDACLGMDEEEGVDELILLIDSEDNSENIKLLFGSTSEYVDDVDSEILAKAIYAMVTEDDSLVNDPAAFTGAMDNAISLAALNEGLGDVLAKKDVYGLDADYVDVYNKELSAQAKASFASDIYKGKGVYTAEGVAELFNDGVVKAFVSSFDGWSDAETLIEKFGSDIGVDMTDYNKLKTSGKSKLYEYVIKLNDKDIDDIVKKINDKTEDLLGDQGSGGGGSTGSSGGGISGGTVTTNPIVSGKPDGFMDMAGSEWAETAVNSLYEKGIVNGVGEKLFAPGRNITREEMLTMLLNAFGVSVSGAATDKFADVSANAWYAPYVAKGYELGVTEGISDTMFGSGREITREEASAMALRIATAFGKSFYADGTVFTDDASISAWAKDAVYALKGAGVINGVGDGSFAPKANCTRAQAAVIIYALINK